jgi:hypothetical protein
VRTLFALPGLVLASCAFHPGGFRSADDAGDDASVTATDASTLADAGMCVAASVSCADSSTLRTCVAGTPQPTDTTCLWSCDATGGAHCTKLQPSGGAVTAANLDPDAQLQAINFAGTIDADTGAMSGLRAAGPNVIAGIDYHLVNNVAVFRFGSLHITGAVSIGGTHAVAFVANGDITIDGIIDVRGSCSGNEAGPGGLPGGAIKTSAGGQGGGIGGAGGHDNCSGGSGGGHGFAGGQGGKSSGTSNTTGGGTFGDATISMLVGGGGGGGGGGNSGGAGGGGGGALQLASNGTITIGATGAAGVNAGGCGGNLATNDGGGGGGAGGAILVEARVIHIGSLGVLAVNGGGGGGADSGSTAGTDGLLSGAQANGGATGSSRGGKGGAQIMLGGADGADYKNGLGGGGGVGWIRINTRAASATLDSGSLLSPALTDTSSTTSQGPAVVQ